MTTMISRRSFLKGSLGVTGLTIAVSITPFGYRIVNASTKKGGFKPNVWFEITPDNIVTVTLGASEMGQGSHTALAMIIADELEADWKQIRVRQGEAREEYKNPIMGGQITVASATVRGFYEPLRKAGATGRAMLIKAAAQTWKVSEEECRAEGGKVIHKKSGKSLTYGQLCLKASGLEIPKEVKLKDEKEFKYVGKPIPRVDIPEKVSGKAIYGIDISMPEMLYAVIARPPAYGAKPLSYDQKASEGIKGVVQVVPTPHGIAVCGKTLEAVLKGRDALSVNWDKGSHPQLDNDFIEKSLTDDLNKKGSKVIEKGDVKKALGEASKRVESLYFVPFIAHTTMEPMNCTAYVKKDRCDVWVPTQGQTVAQIVASQISGLPLDRVHVHTTYLGCGLGRRAAPDFVVDAVIISKAIGKPIKVFWTREEDIKYDAFRAAMAHRIEAGLDSNGRLTGWNHKVVSGSILKDINPKAIINGVDFMSLWGLADFPGSPHNNRIMYDIPNFYVEFLISDLPIPVSPWRSVQNAPNAFVIESFVDELAYEAKRDPLEFRLELLKNNSRPRRVLEVVAEKSGWGKPLQKGMGRGISQHSCFGSYVAQVAEVSVDEKNGNVKVHKIVCAVDCGLAVAPKNIEAQMEGGIVIGLSSALKEEIIFSKGGVKSSNFDDYKVIRMSEIPDIEVHIVESKEKMGGIGEPGVPPIAPAVGNAIFNTAGVRLRRIPFTPQLVKSALEKK